MIATRRREKTDLPTAFERREARRGEVIARGGKERIDENDGELEA